MTSSLLLSMGEARLPPTPEERAADRWTKHPNMLLPLGDSKSRAKKRTGESLENPRERRYQAMLEALAVALDCPLNLMEIASDRELFTFSGGDSDDDDDDGDEDYKDDDEREEEEEEEEEVKKEEKGEDEGHRGGREKGKGAPNHFECVRDDSGTGRDTMLEALRFLFEEEDDYWGEPYDLDEEEMVERDAFRARVARDYSSSEDYLLSVACTLFEPPKNRLAFVRDYDLPGMKRLWSQSIPSGETRKRDIRTAEEQDDGESGVPKEKGSKRAKVETEQTEQPGACGTEKIE